MLATVLGHPHRHRPAVDELAAVEPGPGLRRDRSATSRCWSSSSSATRRSSCDSPASRTPGPTAAWSLPSIRGVGVAVVHDRRRGRGHPRRPRRRGGRRRRRRPVAVERCTTGPGRRRAAGLFGLGAFARRRRRRPRRHRVRRSASRRPSSTAARITGASPCSRSTPRCCSRSWSTREPHRRDRARLDPGGARRARTRRPRRSPCRGCQRMRLVVLPQAMRIAVPPLGNQYLNLTKNSSLAVAISYFELTKVTPVSIANRAPAVPSFALLLVHLPGPLAVHLGRRQPRQPPSRAGGAMTAPTRARPPPIEPVAAHAVAWRDATCSATRGDGDHHGRHRRRRSADRPLPHRALRVRHRAVGHRPGQPRPLPLRPVPPRRPLARRRWSSWWSALRPAVSSPGSSPAGPHDAAVQPTGDDPTPPFARRVVDLVARLWPLLAPRGARAWLWPTPSRPTLVAVGTAGRRRRSDDSSGGMLPRSGSPSSPSSCRSSLPFVLLPFLAASAGLGRLGRAHAHAVPRRGQHARLLPARPAARPRPALDAAGDPRRSSVGVIEFFRGVPLVVLVLMSDVALGFFFPQDVLPGKVVRVDRRVHDLHRRLRRRDRPRRPAVGARGPDRGGPGARPVAVPDHGLDRAAPGAAQRDPGARRPVHQPVQGHHAACSSSASSTCSASPTPSPSSPASRTRTDAEALAFAALLFWVGSYTMSRESQRLEKRLGVGTR